MTDRLRYILILELMDHVHISYMSSQDTMSCQQLDARNSLSVLALDFHDVAVTQFNVAVNLFNDVTWKPSYTTPNVDLHSFFKDPIVCLS
jgi:hypothetical protein